MNIDGHVAGRVALDGTVTPPNVADGGRPRPGGDIDVHRWHGARTPADGHVHGPVRTRPRRCAGHVHAVTIGRIAAFPPNMSNDAAGCVTCRCPSPRGRALGPGGPPLCRARSRGEADAETGREPENRVRRPSELPYRARSGSSGRPVRVATAPSWGDGGRICERGPWGSVRHRRGAVRSGPAGR